MRVQTLKKSRRSIREQKTTTREFLKECKATLKEAPGKTRKSSFRDATTQKKKKKTQKGEKKKDRPKQQKKEKKEKPKNRNLGIRLSHGQLSAVPYLGKWSFMSGKFHFRSDAASHHCRLSGSKTDRCVTSQTKERGESKPEHAKAQVLSLLQFRGSKW